MTVGPVFFVYVGERQIGPLTRADLEARASRGEVGTEDLVWETGTLGWVKAGEVIDFDLIRYAGDAAAPGVAAPREQRAGVPPRGSAASRIGALLDDFRSLSLSEMVPLSRLLDPETLGRTASWILLVFGLSPLFLGTVLEDPVIRIRLFNLGCGALWLAFFLAVLKPDRISVRPGLAGFLTAAVVAVLFVSILARVPPLAWLHHRIGPGASVVLNLACYLGALAPLEELAKAGIVLLLARHVLPARDTESCMFLGLMTGLGYGIYEATVFSDWAASGLLVLPAGDRASIVQAFQAAFVSGVVRMATLPLLHAAWTGMAGYFVGLSFASNGRPAATLVAGLSIPIVAHGLYRGFLASGLGFFAFLVAGLTLLLLLAYGRNASRPLPDSPRAIPPR